MVTGGVLEHMGFEIRPGLESWSCSQELCILGQLFEVQFLISKWRSINTCLLILVVLNETIYIEYLAQAGDSINGNCYYHLFV